MDAQFYSLDTLITDWLLEKGDVLLTVRGVLFLNDLSDENNQ